MPRDPLPLTGPPPPLDAAGRGALRVLYAGLERSLAAAGASCRACGDCCRLVEWGHELRVSPLELALFADGYPLRAPSDPGVCPYLEDGRCGAREGRILGCRAFHCDISVTDMEDAHARAFDELRVLHEERSIPFEQGDWLATLSSVGAG